MPVIRISDKSMRRLETWAEPLEDTAESAFARVLDAAERHRKETRSPGSPESASPAGRKTACAPKNEFRRPLLEILHDMGGRASVSELKPAMKKRMSSRLREPDPGAVGPGRDPKWWNNVCRARNDLKTEGYLRDDSERGVWELSRKGKALVDGWRGEGTESFVDHLLVMPEVGEDGDFHVLRSGPRPTGI